MFRPSRPLVLGISIGPVPTVATADALATALVALGPKNGAALAERQEIPALFIVRDGGGFREIMTAGFSAAVIG